MAAQRKVKKKTTKSAPGSQDSKDEALTPNGIKDFPGQSYDETDLKEVSFFTTALVYIAVFFNFLCIICITECC